MSKNLNIIINIKNKTMKKLKVKQEITNKKEWTIRSFKSNNWRIKILENNEGIVKMYDFSDIKFKFSNKMLNEENRLIELSKSKQEKGSLNKFQFSRLLGGLVPFVILFEKSPEEYENYLIRIDDKKYSFCLIECELEQSASLIIAAKGKIGELFDIESLEEDYRNSGIIVNMKQYQHLEIIDCAKNLYSYEDLTNDKKTLLCLEGLINGFPIENTISICYACKSVDWEEVSNDYKNININ